MPTFSFMLARQRLDPCNSLSAYQNDQNPSLLKALPIYYCAVHTEYEYLIGLCMNTCTVHTALMHNLFLLEKTGPFTTFSYLLCLWVEGA
jgi:hypothetical protein